MITGISGFIGQSLESFLTEQGYEVWGISRNENTKDNIIQGDLMSRESTAEALSKIPSPATIIHTAALAHATSKEPGNSYLEINTQITQNLLESIKDTAVKFIFLSSIAVYGNDGGNGIVLTSNKLAPSTEYGLSKLNCENLIKCSTNLSYNILRLTPVFDDHVKVDIEKRVYFPGQKIFKFYLLPSPAYSFCHIDTLIKNIFTLVKDNSTDCSIMNIADPDPYDQNNLASEFPGIGIYFPGFLFIPVHKILGLILNRFFYKVQCILGKILKDNIYN